MTEDYIASGTRDKLRVDPFAVMRQERHVMAWLRELWFTRFDAIGFGSIAESMFTTIEESQGVALEVVIRKLLSFFEIPEFNRSIRINYPNSRGMDFNCKLLESYISNATSFLDYGAGKLALVRKLSKTNISLLRIDGFEPGVLVHTMPPDGRVHFFNSISGLEQQSSYDCIHCSFVLHHLTDQETKNALRTMYNLLSKNGVFLLIEEAFPIEDLKSLVSSGKLYLEAIGYQLDEKLSTQFTILSNRKKFLAIYLNDLLMNLKNLHYLPWTFNYRAMEGWREVAKEAGFNLQESHYLAIPQSGKLKQGIVAMMVFIKN